MSAPGGGWAATASKIVDRMGMCGDKGRSNTGIYVVVQTGVLYAGAIGRGSGITDGDSAVSVGEYGTGEKRVSAGLGNGSPVERWELGVGREESVEPAWDGVGARRDSCWRRRRCHRDCGITARGVGTG